MKPLHISIRPSMLVEQAGGSYARQLGIKLADARQTEIQKWFIAALLYGARISETIASHAYRELERSSLLDPKRMVDAGWDALVQVLDRGSYVRYDFKTATKLLDVNHALREQYNGDLNRLHAAAADEADLEQRLRRLGKGIGEVTVNIFLRELRGVWSKAEPLPSERAIRSAKALGFVPVRTNDPVRILRIMLAAWAADGGTRKNFPDFEAALIRFEATLRGRGTTHMPMRPPAASSHHSAARRTP
jgi:hypothetical protein